MTFYDAYIGDPAEPGFDPVDGDWNGNFPKGMVLLPQLGYKDPFDRILSLDRTHGLPTTQTDWGCWVTIASREKILELLNEWYGDAPISADCNESSDSIVDVREIVSKLEPKDYYLVALET